MNQIAQNLFQIRLLLNVIYRSLVCWTNRSLPCHKATIMKQEICIDDSKVQSILVSYFVLTDLRVVCLDWSYPWNGCLLTCFFLIVTEIDTMSHLLILPFTTLYCLPNEAIQQWSLALNQIFNKLLVATIEIFLLRFQGFDCRNEVVSAVLNAFRFTTGEAFDSIGFVNNLTDEEAISIGILEKLLILLLNLQRVQYFEYFHLHLKCNRWYGWFYLLLLTGMFTRLD